MNPGNFFSELKRRNVYKVAVAYAVVGWLVIQVATSTFPVLEIPNWATRLVIAVVLLGFPIALVIAWAFEMTPEGMKRTQDVSPDEKIPQWSRRKFAAFILVVVICAAALLGYQVFRSGATRSVASNAAANPEEATARVPQDKSIAVLPFENLSEDKANAFFASGIQDEILTRLAKINSLKVISRTSTQQYQSKPSSVGEIGRQLGVANILEGSVQRVGNAVHINVQLIKAGTDAHLWAESYNRKLDDIFAVEGEVATAIADQLNAKLSGSEKKELAQKPTDNPVAYEAYLRGVTQMAQDNLESFDAAANSFEEAVRLDPKFALAWAALCHMHALVYLNNVDMASSRRAAAERAVNEAVRLQPQLPEVQLARATFQYAFLRDFTGARDLLQQLREIWPGNAEIVQLMGWISARLGEYQKCADYLDQANALNPRDHFLRRNAITIHIAMRDFATGLRMADDAGQIWPGDANFEGVKAQILQAQGELTRAQSILDPITTELIKNQSVVVLAYQAKLRRTKHPPAALQEECESAADKPNFSRGNQAALLIWTDLLDASGDKPRSQALLTRLRSSTESLLKEQPNNWRLIAFRGLALAGLGERDEALRAAGDAVALTANDAREHGIAQELKARLLARSGDKDGAIPLLQHLLEISYDGAYGPPLTPALLRLDPDFDSLRDDPRFEKLCQDTPK
jgi:TolB-like protein/Flp pilus assembly protein TadD